MTFPSGISTTLWVVFPTVDPMRELPNTLWGVNIVSLLQPSLAYDRGQNGNIFKSKKKKIM